MQTIASVALAFLAVVVLVNLANGTLLAWLRAKFLHIAPTPAAAPTGGGGGVGHPVTA